MFTLFVNGIPALRLSGASEIPAPQGSEEWQVVDEKGQTVAFYKPKSARKNAAPDRRTPAHAYQPLHASHA